MAKTDPIDPNVPAGSEDPKLGNDRIQELARAVAEILGVDHYIGSDGGEGVGYNEDAAGEHAKIKFNAPIATPTNVANKFFLYGKDVNSKIEAHVLDEDGNEIQFTSAGKLYAPNFLMPSGGVAQLEIIQAVNGTGVLLKNDGGDTVVTVQDDGTALLADGSLLATSAAPTTDAMMANKKYVDDQVDTKNAGLTTTLDDENNTMVVSHAYLCNQDGFVEVVVNETGLPNVVIYDDSDANPSSGGDVRARYYEGVYHSVGNKITLTVYMKSGRYFEVTASGATVTIRWCPVGTLIKCTDYN